MYVLNRALGTEAVILRLFIPVAFFFNVEHTKNFPWTALYKENSAEGC